MIIDKVKPYWTEEKRQRLKTILDEQERVFANSLPHSGEDILKKWRTLEDESNAIAREVETRYSEDRKKQGILEDSKEIIAAIEKSDFLRFITTQRKFFDLTNTNEAAISEDLFSENATSCYWFIMSALRVQLNSLAEDKETVSSIIDLANAKAKEFYPDEQARGIERTINNPADSLILESFLALPNSPLMNLIENILRLKYDFKYDKLTKTAYCQTKEGYLIAIENYDKVNGGLSVAALKLFDLGRALLVQNNFYGNGRAVNPTVMIGFDKYLELCGIDITPKDDTPKEAKRAEERIKKYKRSIKDNLEDLSKIRITGTETRGRNKGDYRNMRIISSFGIERGYIKINFDIDAARYFVRTQMAQFPIVALLIDNRNPNAYALIFKLSIHNSNDHNFRAGTNNTLSVESLLKVMPEVPNFEDLIEANQRNWKDKIKKPLEKALSELVSIGYLKEWQYRKTGKKIITYTPEQASRLSWESFSSLMVDFVVIGEPDQKARRERAAQRAIANKAKAEEKEIRIEATRRNKAAAKKTSE